MPTVRQAKSNRHVVIPSTVAETPSQHFGYRLEPYVQEVVDKYVFDPFGFVRDVFTWGQGFLRDRTEPLVWQSTVLDDITAGLQEHPDIFRLAIASGKGTGKTALLAQLFLWHVATHPESQTTMTATTGRQIQDRPWREVRKWLWASRLAPFFMIQSSKVIHRQIDTWYGSHQTWSEERPEAFQGSHEQHVAFLVDEASGVPDSILETIESGLTDAHTFLALFSNPTRPTGRFRECFPGGRLEQLWESYQIDGRDVEITNKTRIQEQLNEVDGNEDATPFRVNVRGQFALAGADTFIGEDVILLAQAREDEPHVRDPHVIGVDVARFGGSKTVFLVRQGCRIVEKRVYAKQELDVTAQRLMELADKYSQYRPIMFIDVIGYGAGVYDICRTAGYRVEEVNSALPANDNVLYANKRVEMWADTREWLRTLGCLPVHDRMLAAQLIEPTYHFDLQGRFQLESKESMQSRGMASPDEADALTYTFAQRLGRHRAGTWGRKTN